MVEALVGIVMGSKSDLETMKACEEQLAEFGVPYELIIASAHRNPDKVHEWAGSAAKRGLKVIIAAAGKAAHLAGVIAANTPLPVIGLPIKSSTLDGLDSLLSTVQMPKGVPVATVAIDGAENAALLAVQILAVKYPELREAMRTYKKTLEREIINADKEFREGTGDAFK